MTNATNKRRMEKPHMVIGLADFAAFNKAHELEFRKNDIFKLLNVDDSGWAKGEVDGKVGWFPFSYVKILDENSKHIQIHLVRKEVRLGFD